MGGGRVTDADAAAQQNRHGNASARHVAHLGDLIENLAERIEEKIGEHEIDYRARAGHGGAASQADEAALADRRIAQPLRTVQSEQSFGRLEVAAALADAFAEYENCWISGHFLRQRFMRRLHEGDLALAGPRRRGSLRGGRSLVNVRCRRLRIGPRTFVGELLRLGDEPGYFGIHGVQRGRRRSTVAAVVKQTFVQAADRAARLPLLDLLPRAIGKVSHALSVRPSAVRLAFDQRGAAAGAGVAHRLAGRFVNGLDIIAVHLAAGQTIRGGADGYAGIAGRVGERHFRGELVVLADEQHRQFPNAGEVQAFVERAIVHRAIAEEGDGNAVAVEQLETVAGAGGLEDAGADDAAGAHQPDFGGEKVHAAAAAARTAGLPAIQLGDQLARWQSLRQSVTVAAMCAEHRVVRP